MYRDTNIQLIKTVAKYNSPYIASRLESCLAPWPGLYICISHICGT